MTGGLHGPPDDPSNRPTRMANYGADGARPPGSDDHPDYAESPEPESPPAPWYRNRSLLVVWATMVAILIALIIYGLIQLSHGGGGGAPSTTTPETTPTRSSSPTPSTTPPSTTTTPPPSPSSSEEQGPPAGNAPPPAQAPPPAAPPEHHHHVPHIPSTITLPHTVITLPHGF